MNEIIFDLISQPSLIIDSTGIITKYNNDFKQKLNISEEYLLNHNFFDFISPKHKKGVLLKFHNLINHKILKIEINLAINFHSLNYEHYDITICEISPNEKEFLCIINNLSFQGNKIGEIANYNLDPLIVNSPITLFEENLSHIQKFFESELRAVKKINLFFETHPEKLYQLLYKINILNPNTTSHTKEKLIKSLGIPLNSKNINQNHFTIQFLPLIIEIGNKKNSGEFELIFTDLKGKIKILTVKWNTISGYEVSYERCLLSFYDNTNIKKELYELQSSKKMFNEIIDSFGGEIFTCSDDHVIEYSNNIAKSKRNYAITGKKCYKAIFGLNEPCEWCQNEKLFEKGISVQREILSPRTNRWYNTIITPIFHPDGTRSKTIIMIDITDNKNVRDYLEVHSQRLEILNQIYKNGQDLTEITEFFKSILDSCISNSTYNHGGIIIYDNNISNAVFMGNHNLPEEYMNKMVKTHYQLIEKMPTFSTDPSDFFETQTGLKNDIGSIATVPILSRNNCLGYLILMKEDKNEFSNTEMDFLLALGNEIGTIVQNLKSELELKESLNEKEVLLKEIHHRVKNNLQIIISLFNLQSRNLQDEQLQNIFQESKNRVKSMALIHEILYQSENYAQIDYANYIKILVDTLIRSYRMSSAKINVKFLVECIDIDLNQAIPLALIVNELVSNSLKYAFTEDSENKIIEISLAHVGDLIQLSIFDNGVGLKPEFKIDESNSLGLRLVQMLTKQLGGSIKIESTSGLRFIIKFKPTSLI